MVYGYRVPYNKNYSVAVVFNFWFLFTLIFFCMGFLLGLTASCIGSSPK